MTNQHKFTPVTLDEIFDSCFKPIPWYKKFYYEIINLYRSIKQTKRKIKLIWKNRWILKHFISFRAWDYAYLYRLMGDAFEQMETKFRENGSGVNSHKDAKSLQICKNACYRIADDHTLDDYYQGKLTEQERLFSRNHIMKTFQGTIHKDILLAELKRKGLWWY
jgi:hypothetical protein